MANLFKKFFSVICSFCLAMSVVAVNAFAAEGDTTSGVNLSDVSTKILSGFTGIINSCVELAVAIVPLGLGLFAVGKMWDVAKCFFIKSIQDVDDPVASGRFTAEEWAEYSDHSI